MCGIAGLVAFKATPPQAEDILRMCAAIRHRGPDATGYGLYGRAALGNTRLKIIDLSEAANQPVSNEDRSIHVVFNGEIYNYRGLRENLIRSGHRLRTQSDTEVLVHLYEEEQEETRFVQQLDGMFALALWDERKQQLLLARDRPGKKPLFYYQGEGLFAFASEIKALLTCPNVPSEVAAEFLPAYLSFGYVPCPHTLYRGIHQLPPGHLAILAAGGRLHIKPYWRLRMQPDESIQFEDACEQVRLLTRQAVRKRLVSDVPLGVLLSGGVDSSIVTGLASQELGKVKTFCAAFPEDPAFDETRYARIVARHFATDHHELEIRPQTADLIEKLVYHHDQPFMDSSAVPTYLISQLARQHVTVVLNGDGGDELFAGYARFFATLLGEGFPRWLLRCAREVLEPMPFGHTRLWSRLLRFTENSLLPAGDRYLAYVTFFLPHLREMLRPEVHRLALSPLFSYRECEAEAQGLSPLARLLYINYREYLLNDLNVKMDRCTMANSLEARSPFLDAPLTEYAAWLPDRYKLRGRTSKYILKKAFQGLLPVEILKRGKMGFGVPLKRWFRNDIHDFVQDTLGSSSARIFDYLEAGAVQRFVVQHLSGDEDWSNHLWLLLTLEIWLRCHRKVFDRSLSAPMNQGLAHVASEGGRLVSSTSLSFSSSAASPASSGNGTSRCRSR